MTPFRLLLALALALGACAPSTPPSAPPPGAPHAAPPTVRGTLSEVRHSATGTGLTVDAEGAACGMAAVTDGGTRVMRRAADGSLAAVGVGAAGVGALAVGDRVSVWAAGPVLESCPMQGRAGVVVVEPVETAEGALLGEWVHAVEEDAGRVEVYRRGDPDRFPPRMYRQRYAFARGGRARALVAHPADAHYLADGTWALRGDRLVVRYEGRVDRLRVVELTPEVLRVVRRS